MWKKLKIKRNRKFEILQEKNWELMRTLKSDKKCRRKKVQKLQSKVTKLR